MRARRWLRDLDRLVLDAQPITAATSVRVAGLLVRCVVGALVGGALGLLAVYPTVLILGWLT